MTAVDAPRSRGTRRYRLTGVGAFEAVFRAGRRREGTYVQVVYAPAAAIPGRVGYVLGKKSLPLAVDRNRLRRMLRPIVAQARPAIESYDVILRLKKACPRSALPVVAAEARALLLSILGREPAP